tara:strand:- start:576 stop:1280 length:705 start_codon:yes stop_codon:yes gene_type:complete
MKLFLLTFIVVLLSGCATSKVKQAGQKIERFRELQSLSYDEDHLYISFTAIDRTGKDKNEYIRWARLPISRVWNRAIDPIPGTHLARYPSEVEYQGEQYEVQVYQLNENISETDEFGWEIILDESLIGPMERAIAVQKESGSKVDSQSSIFGSSDSNLFLFTYPDRDPQLVLLNREEKKAVFVWRFAMPHGYEFTPEKYRGVKAAVTPLANTVDIVTLPVQIPAAIMTANPSGK